MTSVRQSALVTILVSGVSPSAPDGVRWEKRPIPLMQYVQ